ncbi:MAG: glycosyltransferase family 2 protein [bacterium]
MTTPRPRPEVSVVLPTYNDASILRHALAHLARQALPPTAFEVVVVDDGSTDETPEVVAAAGAGPARVRSVRFDRNRGRSAARNAGIRAALAPLIVFVDSDVLVRSDFLQQHMEIHRSAARPVVGRGPVVLITEPEIPARPPIIGMSPAYIDTANASVMRQALIDAGLFDEGFPAYGWEDFELGLRLKARGLPRAYSSAAVAFHVQPHPTTDSFGDWLAKEEDRARTALYLLRKHPSREARMLIQDTALQRAGHFVWGGAGLLSARQTLSLARWLHARNLHSLAFFITRGILNRHYLQSLDRLRMEKGNR